MKTTAAQLANAPLTHINGIWQRHLPARYSNTALEGRRTAGRWGTRDGFPVLYLGRPEDSVVVEAYRHLVDPVETPLPPEAFVTRILVTAEINVTDVLDLRTPTGRSYAGLTMSDLQSATTDRDAYHLCQTVAQLAHQLGWHGIVAPAATAIGETLALFTDLLPSSQAPMRVTDQLWERLPDDPRAPKAPRLRVVGPTD
jgi:RES domain-containing protein